MKIATMSDIFVVEWTSILGEPHQEVFQDLLVAARWADQVAHGLAMHNESVSAPSSPPTLNEPAVWLTERGAVSLRIAPLNPPRTPARAARARLQPRR